MAKNVTTSIIIDELLRLAVDGLVISAAVLAPNALIGMSGPLDAALDKLNERQRERELRRIITNMERGKLLAKNYEHGLEITSKGRRRLKRREFDTLAITPPEKWDGVWRIVIFDIPEERRLGRAQLTSKLRELGFKPLQQSAWIHPFACRDEVCLVAEEYTVSKFVTYIETSHIDHENLLLKRFDTIMHPCK